MRLRSAVLAFALLAAAGSRVSAETAAPAGDFSSDGFRLAVPPYTFAFPRDHAAHSDYRTEWWYYTGHLASGERRFGYEVTFFRVALARGQAERASAWAARDLIFMHLALTDETHDRFRHFEAVRRAAVGLAGADTTRMHVWLDDSSVELADDGTTHRLIGRGEDFALSLALSPVKPPAIHGAGGVSPKSAGRGNASHYYSLTRLDTRGTLVVGRDTLEVTGRTWMDHEFSSSGMAATHAGWDWVSVQLEDGRDLMLYQMRLKNGGIEPLSHGTVVRADGTTRALKKSDFEIEATGTWTSPHTKAAYPSGWIVRVPAEQIELGLTPTVKDQELTVPTMGGIAYWEGSVTVKDLRPARVGPAAMRGREPLRGAGYVELTGYSGPIPF